jgi:uncharacterized membrane protein
MQIRIMPRAMVAMPKIVRLKDTGRHEPVLGHHVPSFHACRERLALIDESVEVKTAMLISGGDTHLRSIFKAISWRTLGTFDTFAISWFLTGKVAVAGSIAALEVITKVAWYYFHERMWAAVIWGRR